MRAYDPQSDLPACHFHDQIVDALTRCDVPAAQQAMTRDIGRVFRLLDIEIGAAPAEWGEAGQAAAS